LVSPQVAKLFIYLLYSGMFFFQTTACHICSRVLYECIHFA